MSNLPQVNWTADPIFLPVPKLLVLGIAALIAGYSLVQDIRKKNANTLWTLVFFAGLAAAAWKFTEAQLSFPYYAALVVALVLEGARRKASDNYVTAALFTALAFIAWRFLGDELELRYYSLLFVGVFLGGYALLKWQIVRGGGPAEDAGDFIVYGVLGVLVGARLGHVLFYDLDKALADPKWIFMIWTGGLASHGAVIGLITVMWLFTKQRGIPFLEGADRFSFSAALGATLVRIGNLMNSEIVGRRVPGNTWGFKFPHFDRGGDVPYRYPTQIAEILLGFLVLGALYVLDKRLGKEKRPRGVLISAFFTLYFIGRFIIEFWKEYEPPLPAGTPYPTSLTTGQILSLPGILLGFFGLYWAFKHRIRVGWPGGHADDDADEKPSKRKAQARDEDEEDADDDDDDDESPRPKAKVASKGKKGTSKGKKKAKDADDDADDDDADDDDADDDDADDDDADDDDADDDDADDDDRSDNEDPDEDDDEPERQRDADIDDEFDEKGALKRRRGPTES